MKPNDHLLGGPKRVQDGLPWDGFPEPIVVFFCWRVPELIARPALSAAPSILAHVKEILLRHTHTVALETTHPTRDLEVEVQKRPAQHAPVTTQLDVEV